MFKQKTLSLITFFASMAFAILPITTQAQTADLTLAPGQTGTITIDYINFGDTDATTGQLSALIGSDFEFVPGSIREQFGGGTIYCVTDSVVTTGAAGTAIEYTPRTATTTSAPCNGMQGNNTIPTPLPASPEVSPSAAPSTWPTAKAGVLTFQIRLRETVTDPVGTVIGTSALRPAVQTQITLNENQGNQANLLIGVGERSCPTGQVLEGNNCVPITCPDGQVLQGNNCVVSECPTGQQLVSGQCEDIICTTGFTLQGNNCVPITCPDGQTLQGNICIITQTNTITSGGVMILGGVVALSTAAAAGIFAVSRKKAVDFDDDLTSHHQM